MAITQSSKQASEGKDLPFPDSEIGGGGGEGVGGCQGGKVFCPKSNSKEEAV